MELEGRHASMLDDTVCITMEVTMVSMFDRSLCCFDQDWQSEHATGSPRQSVLYIHNDIDKESYRI
jgi:hypothetical protein